MKFDINAYSYSIETDYKSLSNHTMLIWTTEPPTVEGWYWVNTKYQESFTEKIKVVLLYLNSEAVFQYEPDEHEFFPDEKNFLHYLGPLPVPDAPDL